MDPDPDPATFVIDLQDANRKLIITLWRYIYIIFQRKIVQRSQKTVGIKVFLTIFAWWKKLHVQMLSEMILGSVAMTHQVGNMKLHLLGKIHFLHIFRWVGPHLDNPIIRYWPRKNQLVGGLV
jgi:hypothetical protein